MCNFLGLGKIAGEKHCNDVLRSDCENIDSMLKFAETYTCIREIGDDRLRKMDTDIEKRGSISEDHVTDDGLSFKLCSRNSVKVFTSSNCNHADRRNRY